VNSIKSDLGNSGLVLQQSPRGRWMPKGGTNRVCSIAKRPSLDTKDRDKLLSLILTIKLMILIILMILMILIIILMMLYLNNWIKGFMKTQILSALALHVTLHVLFK
jgi:hypothetical protein